MVRYEIHPFLKWVGGKRQLLNEIKKRMPIKFNDFYEPFVGGGALFMYLQNPTTIINDYSAELIEAYLTIKSQHLELMELLDEHEEQHEKNPNDYFYKIRELDRDKDWVNQSSLLKTARMVYLNKTCYNGMYRVNKKGYFNVPFNGKKIVKTYEKDNIVQLNKYLNEQNVIILQGDFELAVKNAKHGDFIFFDPPYDFLKKDTFDSYTKDGFGIDGQIRLSKLVHDLTKKGCYVMVTNHNTPLINELYKDYNIDVVNAKRMINSKADNRTGFETIIYNYKIEDTLYEAKI